MNRLTKRWSSEAGYREVLVLAIPLILSTGTTSVLQFIDRVFLAWYSSEAIAASMPAGMMTHAFMSFFFGVATYVSVFVAQYFGADKHHRIGPVVWQGIYFSLIGGIFLLCMIPFAKSIFGFFGHEAAVQHEEVIYFQVLCLAGFPAVASAALSGFFSGRGKTWPVLWVNSSGAVVNLALNWVLIFGHWGFPEMGIRGAGLATVIASCFTFAVFLMLIFSGQNNQKFHTLKGWRPDKELLRRMLKFGSPAGFQFFLEMFGFTVFMLILGRLGTMSLVASNIAFNINTLAFMPMIGCGTAVSILVGQYLGKQRPDLAEKSSYSGCYITFLYMATIAALYVLTPNIFIAPFAAKADPAVFDEARQLTVVLLRFIAVYCLFDTLNIIFSSAIKGAGDTKFVMIMSVALSWIIMVIPTFIAVVVLDWGILTCWLFATAYVCIMGIGFLLRFKQGKWKEMLVIEKPTSDQLEIAQ